MNPLLLKFALPALAVAGLFLAHNLLVKRAEKEGYRQGFVAARMEFLGRDNEELIKRNLKIVELQDKYRSLEQRAAELVASIANKLGEDYRHVEAQRDALRRELNAQRLRWTASCSPSQGSGGDPAASARPAASEPVATATCELPREVEEALVTLAADADKVATERNALLAIAKADREVCK